MLRDAVKEIDRTVIDNPRKVGFNVPILDSSTSGTLKMYAAISWMTVRSTNMYTATASNN